MSKMYYRTEVAEVLKSSLTNAIRKELTAFADSVGEESNIALRNRIAGMYDLIDTVQQDMEDAENDN